MMCHTAYTHNFIHHQRQQKNKEKSGTNVLLRAVRYGIPGSWTSVTAAPFTEFSWSATFDVVSRVGGPQTGSTTGFSD